MENLKKIYEGIEGSNAQRKGKIESNANKSASMFVPRLTSGAQNEPEERAWIRDMLPNLFFDYVTRTYPNLSPEQANSKMAKARITTNENTKAEVRQAAIKDGRKKDEAAFKQWCEIREIFKKNVAPKVHGAVLDWGIHEVPGLGEKSDFSIFLNRSFNEIQYSPDHDLLVRRVIDAYVGHTENRIISHNGARVMFTVEYVARGV